jgi:hypothetical protein
VHPATLAVTGGIVVLVALLFAWWWTERRGFPLFVDESGYLGFSLDHLHAFDRDGLQGLFDSFRDHPVYGQLVPLSSVPFLLVFGESITAGYLAILAYYAVFVGVTYLIARRVTTPWFAALAALLTALTPEVINFTHMYYFAVPAGAWLAVSVWCYLRSEACDRPAWTIAAGAALGLAPLSRTMALAFVPGVLVAVGLQAVTAPARQVRRLLYLVAGALVGFALAWVWYSKNYSGARGQLEGRFQPDRVGVGDRVGRIDREFRQIVDVFFVPLAVLLAITAVAALVYWWRRRSHRDRAEAQPAVAPESRVDRVVVWLRTTFATDVGFVVVVLGAGVAALFYAHEALAQWVPLVPYAMILAVVCLASIPAGLPRNLLTAGLVVVSLFNLAMLSDVWTPLGELRRLRVPGVTTLTVTDGRGWMDAYVDERGYETGRPGHLPDYFEGWLPLHQEVVQTIVDEAAEQGEVPVVLMRQFDPVFGPNDLILADRLTSESPRLGIGPLRDSRDYEEQLNSEEFGYPNFVIVADAIPDSPAADEQREDNAEARGALRPEGFEVVEVFDLPDGRQAQLWFRAREGS